VTLRKTVGRSVLSSRALGAGPTSSRRGFTSPQSALSF